MKYGTEPVRDRRANSHRIAPRRPRPQGRAGPSFRATDPDRGRGSARLSFPGNHPADPTFPALVFHAVRDDLALSHPEVPAANNQGEREVR